MTYNVHGCVGMDGRRSALRIARVIEQFNPDIVALQELDIGRPRSGHEDQARAVAEILRMDHFFFPALSVEEEQYGDAVLSRFPLHLVKSAILPGHTNWPGHEPRGALWVQIDVGGQAIHVINTHLGLTARERQQQVASLLGRDWCGHQECRPPLILCGDFNFRLGSLPYRRCCEILGTAVPPSGLKNTYCGHRPFFRPDHIFFSRQLTLKECRVGNTDLARIASDHRPLIATFQF